ncbi:CBS domain-containing protein [Nonomuraea jabiensis]|uniref:CBS domain-containing protein n=1 Tax=Nonomuraea jabiensis TaxID=882448 RepID=UPI003D743F65
MSPASLTAAQVMSRILVAVRPDESPLMAWEQSSRHVRALLGRERKPLVRLDTPLARVAAIMLDAAWDAVPVLSDDGPIGMVTARDVPAAVAGRARPTEEPEEVLTGMFHLEPVLPHDNR